MSNFKSIGSHLVSQPSLDHDQFCDWILDMPGFQQFAEKPARFQYRKVSFSES